MSRGDLSLPIPVGISFRDPEGCLVRLDGRIIRVVKKPGVGHLRAFLASTTAREFAKAGRLVHTGILDTAEIEELRGNPEFDSLFDEMDAGMVVEHERVPFASFPYEWPPEMLEAAGGLTVSLAEALLAEGLGLKDATPYNVLFCGPEPIFIDLTSVESRDPHDPVWLPYAQFSRTFLLPLLVNKYFGVPLDQLLTTRREGIEPEEVYRLCGPLRKLIPPVLTQVSIPTWLAARHSPDDATIYQKKTLGDPERARFILGSLLKRLRRTLHRLSPTAKKGSAWSEYMISCHSYVPAEFQEKQVFVENVMAEFSPQKVLDAGCNTGHFSVLAAQRGARVVAIDTDPVVVGHLWRTARTRRLDILPLVVNLTHPTPALGWRNHECPGFLDRARGAFDAVLMLAVVHHMLVSERIPLEQILDLAAELTTQLLVIEFVAPDDPMFRRLTRGRDHLFTDLTPSRFEAVCRRRFEIVRCQHLGRTSRWLYLLQKKQPAIDA